MLKIVRFCITIVCLLESCKVLAQQVCSDCQKVTSCPPALDLLRREDTASRLKLKNAFCGFKGSQPFVCCSQLSSQPPITDDSRDLDSHPNQRLLPRVCGYIDGDKIHGGNVTGLYEFPFMVLISHSTRDGLKFQCGGTLINERYVLTAAHCIVGEQIAGVRVGEHDIRTDTDCQGQPPKQTCESRIQDIRVEQEIPHKEYQGKPNVRNDIGLLRLQRPVDFSPQNAGAVCLPVTSTLRNRYVGGKEATVVGWGYTETGYTSPVMLYVKVPIYQQQDCSKLYNKGNLNSVDVTKDKLCAGEKGKDSCGGDSGGPLMVDGEHEGKKRYVQHGIVSYGPRLCGSNYPGVYTDVAKYMGWILDNIRP